MKNIDDLVRYIELIENDDRFLVEHTKNEERYSIIITIPYEQKEAFFLRYKNLISLEVYIYWEVKCLVNMSDYHMDFIYTFN
jgi:hypothetical protein